MPGAAAYAAAFPSSVGAGEPSSARFEMYFAVVFLSLFLLLLLVCSFLFKRVLSRLGVQVLSRDGDILRTDCGRGIKPRLLRFLVNLLADSFFNLLLILLLIFLAVQVAALARYLASGMPDV